MRGQRGGLEDVCRLSAPGSTVTTTPHPVKRATKVVVVLNKKCPEIEVLEEGKIWPQI